MKEVIKEMISQEAIAKRIQALALDIMKEYEGKTLTLICVLKGGVTFMVDLSKKLEMNVEFDYLDISSYGNRTESSGIIKMNKDLENSIADKHVLLIEDIVDTGRTLSYLTAHLKAQQPASFKVCTLLDKPSRRVVFDFEPDYVGFVIPDDFVIGYGLDYDQRYRNLPYIGILSFEEE